MGFQPFKKFKDDLNKGLIADGKEPATNKDIVLGFAVLLVPALFIGSCLFGDSDDKSSTPLPTKTAIIQENKAPEPTPQSAPVEVKKMATNEILSMPNPPRLYDAIDDVNKFYVNVSKSDVSTTNQDITPNNEVLIFQQVDGKIKTIACYPQRGGLMLNINDAIPLIKSFVPIENVNGDYNIDDATIFAGDGLPTLYAWKYDFNSDPVVAMVQETNGYVSAFGVSRGAGITFPFIPSSMYGYRVEKYGANQPRPSTSQSNASNNNFDRYDSEKRVSTTYVGNAKTGKFHIRSCESVRKMTSKLN